LGMLKKGCISQV